MLSKSKFVAGYQCPKLMWWLDREGLKVDEVLQDLFDQGHDVEERVRAAWPGAEGVRFGVELEVDGVHCVIDALEPNASGWTLIEVKSSSGVKDIHYPDLAFQTWLARQSGLDVTRIEVLHLNRDHRNPAEGALFARSDVTQDVEPLIPLIEARIASLLPVLRADAAPEHACGPHCWELRECGFWDRCWPTDRDHISRLYRVQNKKALDWMARGVHSVRDLPDDVKLSEKPARQVRAVREGRLIVEPGLALALKPALEARRLGFLDFETVMRAIPVWPGLGPWHQAAAQFSYHERGPGGAYSHCDYLAEGPGDPRQELAERMLEATRDADQIVVYTHFESTRIKELAAHLPHLSRELEALRAKLFDLNPVVEGFVYHPDFGGSFSLKKILTPLVPDLSYNDLVIVDGKTASVKIARLLFVAHKIPPDERDRVRKDLLAYCERDTFATVRLVEVLAEMAGTPLK